MYQTCQVIKRASEANYSTVVTTEMRSIGSV